MTVVWAIIIVLAAITGIAIHVRANRVNQPTSVFPGVAPGWVYFMTLRDDEDAPVKVSCSPTRPTAVELGRQLPYPVKVLHTFRVTDIDLTMAYLYDALEPALDHGQWYDRNAALALLDDIKQEAEAHGNAS